MTVFRAHRPFPNRDDIEAFAENLPDAFLHCRAWGHAWEIRICRDVTYEGSSEVYKEFVKYCQNGCGVTGIVVVNNGSLLEVYSGLRYPPGYLTTGIGRMSGAARTILRLESGKRAN